jgi:hypothetical protein
MVQPYSVEQNTCDSSYVAALAADPTAKTTGSIHVVFVGANCHNTGLARLVFVVSPTHAAECSTSAVVVGLTQVPTRSSTSEVGHFVTGSLPERSPSSVAHG